MTLYNPPKIERANLPLLPCPNSSNWNKCVTLKFCRIFVCVCVSPSNQFPFLFFQELHTVLERHLLDVCPQEPSPCD